MSYIKYWMSYIYLMSYIRYAVSIDMIYQSELDDVQLSIKVSFVSFVPHSSFYTSVFRFF